MSARTLERWCGHGSMSKIGPSWRYKSSILHIILEPEQHAWHVRSIKECIRLAGLKQRVLLCRLPHPRPQNLLLISKQRCCHVRRTAYRHHDASIRYGFDVEGNFIRKHPGTCPTNTTVAGMDFARDILHGTAAGHLQRHRADNSPP